MQTQIPRGPDSLWCPTWKKKMSTVCHTCPLWIKMSGKNPNTGQDMDNWHCAMSLSPVLVLEQAAQMRSIGKEIEELRNEFAKQIERLTDTNVIMTKQLASTMVKQNNNVLRALMAIYQKLTKGDAAEPLPLIAEEPLE